MNEFIKLREQNPDRYPVRMGEKWNEEEEINMLTMLKEGKSITQVALSLQRTSGGVIARLKELSKKLLLKGYSIEQIMEITTLDEDMINLAHETNKTLLLSDKKSILSTLRSIRRQIDQVIEHLEE